MTIGQPLMVGQFVTQKKEDNNTINNGHSVPAAKPKGCAYSLLEQKVEAQFYPSSLFEQAPFVCSQVSVGWKAQSMQQ